MEFLIPLWKGICEKHNSRYVNALWDVLRSWYWKMESNCGYERNVNSTRTVPLQSTLGDDVAIGSFPWQQGEPACTLKVQVVPVLNYAPAHLKYRRGGKKITNKNVYIQCELSIVIKQLTKFRVFSHCHSSKSSFSTASLATIDKF
jgi:hypothetical protein